MGRTIAKIEALEEKINGYLQSSQKPASEDVELDLDLGDSEEDEDIEEAKLVGGKFKYSLAHLELDSGKNWLRDLKKDKDQLTGLLQAAKKVTVERDAKLAVLKQLITAKVLHPTVDKLGQPIRISQPARFANGRPNLWHEPHRSRYRFPGRVLERAGLYWTKDGWTWSHETGASRQRKANPPRNC